MSLIVDIKKRLGGFTLDLCFRTDGDVSGLLGASGCGKSMTLMCIAGIIKPDSGKIILNDRVLFDSGKGINLKPQQRRVGYLFQNYALFPNMTVRQNILCGLKNEMGKKEKETLLREIIELMQLRGYEKRRPDQLSGGQQQRVALARILIGSPDLLMLDEPFSALDSHLRGQLQVETKNLLKRFGKDALLVTHNRDEAYQLCNKIALVDSGKLLAYKDTKQLFADPESRQAALLTGCKNVIDAKKAGKYLIDILDWGVRFTASRPVRDGLCAIGVRAHYFDPDTVQNRFPVQIVDGIEEPFEYSMQFRYANQKAGTSDIWWSLPKEKKGGGMPPELGIAAVNVLPLYR